MDFAYQSEDDITIVRHPSELVNDSEEFCYRMGYAVHPEGLCYDGTPKARKIHLNEKSHWNAKIPRNKATIYWTPK